MHSTSSWTEHYAGTGPIFTSHVDEKGKVHESWEDKHARATWEIAEVKGYSGLPEELLGIMDFEYIQWVQDNPGCH